MVADFSSSWMVVVSSRHLGGKVIGLGNALDKVREKKS